MVYFAPSFRYGWSAGRGNETTSGPTPGNAYDKARKWRVEDAIKYLSQFYTAGALRPPHPVDYGLQQLPKEVKWKKTLGHFTGSDRILNDVDINNFSLLQAVQGLARHGGAYDLFCVPSGAFSSQLVLVNMNPKGNTGTPLFVDSYEGEDIAVKMQSGTHVQNGYVTESIINWFPSTTIVGDAHSEERMVTTDPSSTFAIGAGSLDRADSAETRLAAKAYNAARDHTQEAYDQSLLQFPDWMCAFRTGRGVNMFTGSKVANLDNGARYLRIRPSQLTAYSTGGNGNNPANWLTKEIVVEMKYSAQEIEQRHELIPPLLEEWFAAQRYDNLSLGPDSTIVYLEALRRSNPPCYYNHYDEDDQIDEYYIPREIRIQLVVESTHAMIGRNEVDYNHTAPRINPDGPKLAYVTVAKPGDYVDFLRSEKSRPSGELIGEPYRTGFYPRKDQVGNELFTDQPRITDHAAARQTDVNRIDYGGQLIIARLAPGMYPGLAINVQGENTIPVFGVVKCVTFMSEPDSLQHTVVEFGAADARMIYDMPGKYHFSGGSGGFSMNTPKTTTTGTTTDNSGGGGGSGYIGGGSGGGGGQPESTPTNAGKSQSYDAGNTGSSEQETKSGYEGPARESNPFDDAKPTEGAGGDAGNAGVRGGGRQQYTGAPRPYSGPDYKPEAYSGKDYGQVKPYAGKDYTQMSKAGDFGVKPYAGKDYSQFDASKPAPTPSATQQAAPKPEPAAPRKSAKQQEYEKFRAQESKRDDE